MYTIKIIGAGSIGNHLANASRALGWNVILTDADPVQYAMGDLVQARIVGAWGYDVIASPI